MINVIIVTISLSKSLFIALHRCAGDAFGAANT